MDVFENLKIITLIAMCLLGSIFSGFIIGSTVFLALTVVGCTIAPFISVIVAVVTTFIALCIMLDM